MEQDHSYSEEQYGQQSATMHSVRKIRRVAEPRLPFVPYGLIPALGLGVLFLFGLITFAQGWIERTVENKARAAISTSAPWADIDVSGQWVTLKGCPPSRNDGIRAIDAVSRAKANTFLGKASPVTRVVESFDCASTTVTTPPASTDAAEFSDWTFRLENGRLRLEGQVPDEDTRASLGNTARSMIDPPRISAVENTLQVSGGAVKPGYLAVAMRGLNTIGRCDQGAASFIGETFSLNCEAQPSRADAVRETANDALALGRLGTITVSALAQPIVPSETAIANCDASLAALLSSSKIEFATSSATIAPRSYSLLERLASEIRACPGTLVVEGHTDSTGNVSSNDELSRRRADAVRTALIARGVSPGRLYAQGLGSSRPIGSNQTASGRARNRRIEIRVAPIPN